MHIFIIKLLSHKIFTGSSLDLLSKLTTLMTNVLLLLNIIISYKYVMETYNLFLSKPTAFGRDFGITKEEQKLVVLFCRDYHNWGMWCWLKMFVSSTFFFFLTFSKYKCKDPIWLESKTGMDPGPRNPNNEFIECRKES